MDEDCFTIYQVWDFIHSDDFTNHIIIEEVKEVYSTGPAIQADGQVVEPADEDTNIQYCSYSKEDKDEGGIQDDDDIHDTKFLLRFLATNTDSPNRYLWVNDEGEVRTNGGHTNIATFFEVIHWCSPKLNNYQLICYGGLSRGNILYMDGVQLKTRKYNQVTDEKDITTKFQMSTRGNDCTVRAFISKTGIPIYFDNDGNYRPEGPPQSLQSTEEANSELHPLYFITSNVKQLKITQV